MLRGYPHNILTAVVAQEIVVSFVKYSNITHLGRDILSHF